ncbi:MAG: ABC transporter permease subunit [Acidimicrobiia bacterium]|nr:ABC transporter permease subunit [Acidimicrobiia bacterium]
MIVAMDARVATPRIRDLTREQRWVWLSNLGIVVAFILVWQFVLMVGEIESILVPSPVEVGNEIVEITRSGLLLSAFVETMYPLSVGLVLGLTVGILVGLLLGMAPKIDALSMPYVWGAFSTPDIALIPLVIMWLGFGPRAKIFMVFLAVMIPVALSARDGVRTLDEPMVRAAVSFCAGRRDLVLRIVLPGTIPSIATGVRNAISKGFAAVLVVEMTVASNGLGREVMYAMGQFNPARMFAFVVVLVILAMALIAMSKRVESYLGRWRAEVSL